MTVPAESHIDFAPNWSNGLLMADKSQKRVRQGAFTLHLVNSGEKASGQNNDVIAVERGRRQVKPAPGGPVGTRGKQRDNPLRGRRQSLRCTTCSWRSGSGWSAGGPSGA